MQGGYSKNCDDNRVTGIYTKIFTQFVSYIFAHCFSFWTESGKKWSFNTPDRFVRFRRRFVIFGCPFQEIAKRFLGLRHAIFDGRSSLSLTTYQRKMDFTDQFPSISLQRNRLLIKTYESENI